MIRSGYHLPEPADGPTPQRPGLEWQLRRLNRIATDLWEAKEALGGSDRLAVAVHPDSKHMQVSMHLHAPAVEVEALAIVGRLGWDAEPFLDRNGITVHHRWHGMLGGFRASLVWIEEPAAVDSQGREVLPAGVGVGDRAADAEHVRVLEFLPAGLVDNQTGGVVEFTGHDGRRYVTTQQGEHQATPVPPMHADLQRLGYEL